MASDDICPRCGSAKFRSWDELDRDEQIVAERLPASAEFTIQERKKHRFCTRCWFEGFERKIDLA